MSDLNDKTELDRGEHVDLSRRHLLVGSAGLTLGALAIPALAQAQDKMANMNMADNTTSVSTLSVSRMGPP